MYLIRSLRYSFKEWCGGGEGLSSSANLNIYIPSQVSTNPQMTFFFCHLGFCENFLRLLSETFYRTNQEMNEKLGSRDRDAVTARFYFLLLWKWKLIFNDKVWYEFFFSAWKLNWYLNRSIVFFFFSFVGIHSWKSWKAQFFLCVFHF